MWPLSKTKSEPSSSRVGQLFLFKERMFKEGASQPTLQRGLRSFVETYIPEAEFEVFFGGYAARNISGEKYIGVWSVRIASRMRRILRERGASFTVVNNHPCETNQSLSLTHQSSGTGDKVLS
ncbi:hypothetical protein ASG44_07015 [Methylophilus sp. Leaf459]|nr:hypothetical protein ASG34_07040 [Methylophilus sp. Leaf416]KQT56675.1 hypothetical protein ASG44_07015 [Methylophilus sp. Leaf459]